MAGAGSLDVNSPTPIGFHELGEGLFDYNATPAYVFYSITATADGIFSFDTLLSTDATGAAGPGLYVESTIASVTGGTCTLLGDGATDPALPYLGQKIYSITTGATVVIGFLGVSDINTTPYGAIMLRVRTSDLTAAPATIKASSTVDVVAGSNRWLTGDYQYTYWGCIEQRSFTGLSKVYAPSITRDVLQYGFQRAAKSTDSGFVEYGSSTPIPEVPNPAGTDGAGWQYASGGTYVPPPPSGVACTTTSYNSAYGLSLKSLASQLGTYGLPATGSIPAEAPPSTLRITSDSYVEALAVAGDESQSQTYPNPYPMLWIIDALHSRSIDPHGWGYRYPGASGSDPAVIENESGSPSLTASPTAFTLSYDGGGGGPYVDVPAETIQKARDIEDAEGSGTKSLVFHGVDSRLHAGVNPVPDPMTSTGALGFHRLPAPGLRVTVAKDFQDIPWPELWVSAPAITAVSDGVRRIFVP